MCPSFDDPAGRGGRGRLGEDLASAYLRLKGFEVLGRNLRDGPREIDLLAAGQGWFIVVEVRLRASAERGLPEESIHPGKRIHLLRAGEALWLREGRRYGRLRFDLISLLLNREGMRVRHYPHFMTPR